MLSDILEADPKICFAKLPKNLRKRIAKIVFNYEVIKENYSGGEKVERSLIDAIISNLEFYLENECKLSHDLKNALFEYSFSEGIYTWISADICSYKEKLKISDELKSGIFAFTTLEDEHTFPAGEKRNKFIREKLKEFEEMKNKYPEIKLKKYLPEPPHLIIPLSPQIIGNQKDTDEYVKYIDTQLKNLEELSGSIFCEKVLNFYISLSNICFNSPVIPINLLSIFRGLTFWCIIKGVDKNLGDIIIDFICASKVRDYKLFFKEKLKELENCKL